MAQSLRTFQHRSHLPPGVAFILHKLATKVFPIVGGGYATFTALDAALGVSLPPYVTWAALSTAVPVVIAVRVWLHGWSVRRRAAKLGAAIAPTCDGKLPGNYDVLNDFMEEFENGYLGEAFWPVVEELGNTFNMRVFWIDQFVTIEPEHVKQILATEFANFEKGPEFKYSMDSVLGTGVFNSDGDMWKFHRSMTRPFFSRDRINDFAIFARHADATLSHIASRLNEGYAVDFQDAAGRYTLDSATEFLFGTCVNCLESGLPYPANCTSQLALEKTRADSEGGTPAERFARAFNAAQWEISTRSRLGDTWPLWEMFRDRTRKHMKIVNAYIDPILKEALKKKSVWDEEMGGKRNEKDIAEDETLLDHLVKLTDDPVLLKDETLNIMIAGRDTTAATLTFAVYLLAQHPSVLQRLRSEVLDMVGPARAPTLDDIRAMKYLRAVINETLRLYPAVPFNVRTAIKDTTLVPCGVGSRPYFVPAGTSVTYSVFMMHRRKDLWGPDAMEFDPDRFIDERLNRYVTPNPFIFLPFNAGPRICLGQQFAYNEASFMLIRLLQRFDGITLDKSAQPPESVPPARWKTVEGRQAKEEIFPKCHLTIYAHKGLWVKMHEATNV